MRLSVARALAIALLARGTAAAETGQSRQALTGGEPTNDFPAVVALVDDSRVPFCTGALVSNAEVLTAAHCVAPPFNASGWVYFGSVPGEDGDGYVAVDHVWIHPGYDPATNIGDLALVALAGESRIDPLPVLEEPVSASVVSSSVRVVGFGEHGLSPGPLLKRIGWSCIVGLDAEALRLEPNPSTPCAGDSGAPVLLDTVDGPRLIGVVSRGDPLCASHAVATAVDRGQLPFAATEGPQCNPARAGGRGTPMSWWGLAVVSSALIVARRLRGLR